jgi:hypothetical protein
VEKEDFDPTEFNMINGAREEKQYDFIVVGAGSASEI